MASNPMRLLVATLALAAFCAVSSPSASLSSHGAPQIKNRSGKRKVHKVKRHQIKRHKA